jgi:hypothetical protein
MIGRRGLALLGGAAAAALGGGLLLAPEAGRQGPAPAPAFPGLAERLPRAARVELRQDGAALNLLRQGDVWGIAERHGHPCQTSRLRELFAGLSELRLLEPRPAEARTGTDGALAAPAILIRVLDAEGAPLAELILGQRRSRPGEETAFVRRAAEPDAWLAETRLAIPLDPQLWLDRAIADLPAQRLRRVEVMRAGEARLVLQRPGEVDAPLVIVEPRQPARPDGVALDTMGRVFEGLGLLDVAPAADAPGDALGEARFVFTDNLAVAAWPRRAGDQLWVTLRATGDAEAAALNRRWTPWRYNLGSWTEAMLIPRLEDLLEGR